MTTAVPSKPAVPFTMMFAVDPATQPALMMDGTYTTEYTTQSGSSGAMDDSPMMDSD